MTRGASLTSALLATLAQPATWALGLAAFLIRGGVVLVALPVLVLPTPVGVGNVVAPTIVSVAFGQVSIGLVAGAVAIGAGVVAWVCVGGWLAGLLEAEAARIVARDEDVMAITQAAPVSEPWAGGDGRDAALGRGLEAGRILVARLVACVPLGVALAWGSVRLVVVAYRELTNPLDIATPVVVRVVRDAPEVIAVVALAWIAGEIVGAMAARRIVLWGDGVVAALRAAVVGAVRQPLVTLARWGLPLVALVAVLVPSLLAASATWGAVRAATRGFDAMALFIAILAFVTLWLIGLLLIAVVTAWRAAVWTVAAVATPATSATPTTAGPPRDFVDPQAEERPSARHPGLPPV